MATVTPTNPCVICWNVDNTIDKSQVYNHSCQQVYFHEQCYETFTTYSRKCPICHADSTTIPIITEQKDAVDADNALKILYIVMIASVVPIVSMVYACKYKQDDVEKSSKGTELLIILAIILGICDCLLLWYELYNCVTLSSSEYLRMNYTRIFTFKTTFIAGITVIPFHIGTCIVYFGHYCDSNYNLKVAMGTWAISLLIPEIVFGLLGLLLGCISIRNLCARGSMR